MAISKAIFRQAITAPAASCFGTGTFEVLDDLPADAQIKRGDLKFRLHGEKLNGDFALVLMKGCGKGNEWLIIKKKDEFAAPVGTSKAT